MTSAVSETTVNKRRGHGMNGVGQESRSVVPALQAVGERVSPQPGVGSKLRAEDASFWDSWSPIPKAMVSGCKCILEARALLVAPQCMYNSVNARLSAAESIHISESL